MIFWKIGLLYHRIVGVLEYLLTYCASWCIGVSTNILHELVNPSASANRLHINYFPKYQLVQLLINIKHSPINLLTYSPTHIPTYSPTHLPPTRLLICSSTHLLIYSSTHLITYSPTHLLTYSTNRFHK